MQIKVEANDMYSVLTGHGIDETESKAIILDLLLRAEGTVLGVSLETSAPASSALNSSAQDSSEYLDESESSPDDVEHKTVGRVNSQEETVSKAKLRRKRLNFGAFGGAAEM